MRQSLFCSSFIVLRCSGVLVAIFPFSSNENTIKSSTINEVEQPEFEISCPSFFSTVDFLRDDRVSVISEIDGIIGGFGVRIDDREALFEVIFSGVLICFHSGSSVADNCTFLVEISFCWRSLPRDKRRLMADESIEVEDWTFELYK